MTPKELKQFSARCKAIFGDDWVNLLAINLRVTRQCIEAMRDGKRKEIKRYVLDKLEAIETGAIKPVLTRTKPKIGRPARKAA